MIAPSTNTIFTQYAAGPGGSGLTTDTFSLWGYPNLGNPTYPSNNPGSTGNFTIYVMKPDGSAVTFGNDSLSTFANGDGCELSIVGRDLNGNSYTSRVNDPYFNPVTSLNTLTINSTLNASTINASNINGSGVARAWGNFTIGIPGTVTTSTFNNLFIFGTGNVTYQTPSPVNLYTYTVQFLNTLPPNSNYTVLTSYELPPPNNSIALSNILVVGKSSTYFNIVPFDTGFGSLSGVTIDVSVIW
jgi:hypothetical protein